MFISFINSACDSSDESINSVTSSYAVGGESTTMHECKDRINQTASKYNVSYTIQFDERDYFSGKIVKDGIQTDLLVVCRKEDDYFKAMFEVPN